MQTVETPTFKRGKYSLEEILEDLALTFKVTPEYISSRHRKKDKVFIRKIFCYVVKELTHKRFSLHEIANTVGYNNHTSVVHQLDDVKTFFQINESLWLEYWQHYIKHSKIWKEHLNK